MGESSIFSSEGWSRLLLVLLLGDPGLLLLCTLLLGLEGGDTEVTVDRGNKLLMLNFPIGEDTEAGGKLVTGLVIGGGTADTLEAEEVKLPLTSCSNDPRMDELPSEELLPPSLLSDLLPALLSLLPLPPEAAASLFSFSCLRNLGLPTHCWM